MSNADADAIASSAGVPDVARVRSPNTVKSVDVDAVRRMKPTRRGVQAKLVSYADEVLIAVIAAENAAADCRPLFISMIQAELDRRHKERKHNHECHR